MKSFLQNLLKRPAFWKAAGLALVAAGLSTQYAEILQFLGPEIADAIMTAH